MAKNGKRAAAQLYDTKESSVREWLKQKNTAGNESKKTCPMT